MLSQQTKESVAQYGLTSMANRVKFQPNAFNCQFAILNLKGFDYCCIISFISKNEAINLMQNADLTEKSETL